MREPSAQLRAGVARSWEPPPPPTGEWSLTSTEAATRLRRDGPNVVVPGRRGHAVLRRVRVLADPMVWLLLAVAPIYLLIGDRTDAIVAFVAVVPLAGVNWVLEGRAERTLERLRRLTAPAALVWRDAEHVEIRATDVVVDDLVWVREGDVVPADARLVASPQLLVDESSLTGEAFPVGKATGAGADDLILAGSTALSGWGIGRVIATGARTRYASIGMLLGRARRPATPLQRAVSRLVRVLGIAAAGFCVAVVAVELRAGHGLGDALIAGMSLAIAAVPEEFPMVYTLFLALGAWRLAREHALIRRLPAVETLGSTTVICADKTGTLTRGTVTVAEIVALPGVEPQRVREAAVLACEPQPFDPLEIALLDDARANGVDLEARDAAHLVADYPFDTADKYLSHVWARADGSLRISAKGALESLLAVTTPADAVRAAAEEANRRWSDAGARVLAVADGALAVSRDRRADERALSLIGLVAFTDPARDGVAEALDECRTAGIRVIMITGDHPATAHAVAEALRLPHGDARGDVIATGDDLDAASPEALEELVETANVFARTRPEQKHLLVTALQRRGEVVAMTGDGVNDAPALREADIGVAMGVRGTEVAREAATMVLLDDNFSTIVKAVHDGRRIFDNLVRAFAYLVAFHPPLLLAALVVPLLDRPLLLLPVHLVALELLLHPTVSLVFEADLPPDDLMSRPPRPPRAGFIDRRLWLPLARGTSLGASLIVTYLVLLERGWRVEQARALGLATLVVGQLLLLHVERDPETPLWRRTRRATATLWWITAVTAAAVVAVVDVPPLARLFDLETIPVLGWPMAAAIAAISTLWWPRRRAADDRSTSAPAGST